jgi:hypothetical protein
VRRFRALLALCTLALTPSLAGAQTAHLVVITGAGGGPEYSQRFHEWASKLVDAVAKSAVPPANIVYLSETPELGGRITGKSARENVEQALKTLATKTQPGDAVLIVLIGHGSAEGAAPARFNLPGPDLTVADYDRLLKGLEGRKVALVNAASASGAFIAPLSAPGRVVVAATRSGFETNETVFARFFAEAYGGGADTDKDNQVSLLEAYTFAAREVERWYKEQNRLVTEHAQLDDDGDGKGTAAPDGRTGDGAIAKAFLLGGTPAAVASNPELKALYEQKRELEARIETLRGMKSKMDPAVYEKELEKLLVDLALKNQAIRKLEGK